jgi:hypothetical protein
VAHPPVARGDRDFVALAAPLAPELLVHGQVALGDRGILGIEVDNARADDGRARHAEELFPRLVDADVLAVAALEENRNRQDLDQVLRDAKLLGQITRARLERGTRGSGRGLPLLHEPHSFSSFAEQSGGCSLS